MRPTSLAARRSLNFTVPNRKYKLRFVRKGDYPVKIPMSTGALKALVKEALKLAYQHYSKEVYGKPFELPLIDELRSGLFELTPKQEEILSNYNVNLRYVYRTAREEFEQRKSRD